MKKTLIIILVIVFLLAGCILYLYRDPISKNYNNTSQEVSEEIEEVKEEVKENIGEIKEDVVEWFADIQDEIKK